MSNANPDSKVYQNQYNNNNNNNNNNNHKTDQ